MTEGDPTLPHNHSNSNSHNKHSHNSNSNSTNSNSNSNSNNAPLPLSPDNGEIDGDLDTSDEALSPLQARVLDYLGGTLPPLGPSQPDPCEASLASTALVPPINRGSLLGPGPGHQFEQTLSDSTLRGCLNQTLGVDPGPSDEALQELRTLRKPMFSSPADPDLGQESAPPSQLSAASEHAFGVPRPDREADLALSRASPGHGSAPQPGELGSRGEALHGPDKVGIGGAHAPLGGPSVDNHLRPLERMMGDQLDASSSLRDCWNMTNLPKGLGLTSAVELKPLHAEFSNSSSLSMGSPGASLLEPGWHSTAVHEEQRGLAEPQQDQPSHQTPQQQLHSEELSQAHRPLQHLHYLESSGGLGESDGGETAVCVQSPPVDSGSPAPLSSVSHVDASTAELVGDATDLGGLPSWKQLMEAQSPPLPQHTSSSSAVTTSAGSPWRGAFADASQPTGSSCAGFSRGPAAAFGYPPTASSSSSAVPPAAVVTGGVAAVSGGRSGSAGRTRPATPLQWQSGRQQQQQQQQQQQRQHQQEQLQTPTLGYASGEQEWVQQQLHEAQHQRQQQQERQQPRQQERQQERQEEQQERQQQRQQQQRQQHQHSASHDENEKLTSARRPGGVEVIIDGGFQPTAIPRPSLTGNQQRRTPSSERSFLRAPRSCTPTSAKREAEATTQRAQADHGPGLRPSQAFCDVEASSASQTSSQQQPRRPPKGPPLATSSAMGSVQSLSSVAVSSVAPTEDSARPSHRSSSRTEASESRPGMVRRSRSSSVNAGSGVRRPSLGPGVQSNRKLIRNALERYCLKGEANKAQREQILSAFDNDLQTYDRFVILFRSIHTGRHDLRALYGYQNGVWVRVVQSLPSPPALEEKMVAMCLRYDSGAKEFKEVPALTQMLNVADAVFLHPQHLQKSKIVS